MTCLYILVKIRLQCFVIFEDNYLRYQIDHRVGNYSNRLNIILK